jgi:hypothetical protein
MTDAWFDDVPVLGAMDREGALAKLDELGESPLEHEEGEVPRRTFAAGAGWFGRQPRAWQHTAHTFGFVAGNVSGTEEPAPVLHAGAMAAEESLRNAQIKITLDRLRVVDYPGGGIHRVLFDFYAQNQLSTGGVEHLHFNATLRAREGESAATVGYPIFSGLNVGPEGVVFKCFTVNVKNDGDEALLGFLDSDVFKAGLRLAPIAQPALAPLSEMALGLTRAVAKRNRNVAVQDFHLGLDFSELPFRARLATGSYIAVQIPETLTSVWRWDEWVYLPTTGQVVHRDDHTRTIPNNYVVFSISRSG